MLVSLVLATAAVVSPDGSRLHPDEACYAIYGPAAAGNPVIGATRQSIKRGQSNGRPVWNIVVHQRLTNRPFDLRDAFVLDAKTLRPISLSTQRDGKPHAELAYAADRVTGFKVDKAGKRTTINQSLTNPIWEGDLYGPTFAALPLSAGAQFSLPYFQYDRGLGAFTVKVKGSEQVETDHGKVDAWILDAGPSEAERLDYLIAKSDGRELGYRATEGGQRLGGNCTGLA